MFGSPVAYLAAVPAYLGWFSVCVILMACFALLYCLVTPKNELALIRSGSTATAISLTGALVGFSVMMAAVMLRASSRGDLVAWTLFGTLVQLFAYYVAAVLLCGLRNIRANMNERFVKNDVAAGIFVAGLSIAVGIVSAAVMAS